MRKVNYILAGLAGLFLASCSNEDAPDNGGNSSGGNESYLAVKIANPTDSRADGDKYEDGKDDEAKVESMVFYLFDENENPFLLEDGTNKVQPQDEKTEEPIVPDAKPDGSAGDVENVYDPVLVIRHQKGKIPAYIAAVINYEIKTEGNAPVTIDQLRGKGSEYGSSDSPFVMSNAMTDGGKLTPIEEANLAQTVELAKANPIRINVERVLAKVTVDLTNDDKSTTWQIYDGDTPIDNRFARLEGWDITNTAIESYLLKNVEGITNTTAWDRWSNDHRSFWANTEGINITPYDTKYSSITVGPTYLMENTNKDKPTTVIVRATIVDAEDNPVTLALWNGIQYMGIADLKAAMIKFLQGQGYTLYVDKEGNRLTMDVEDIDFIINEKGNKKWEVLPVPATGKTFYDSADLATTAMTDAEVDAVFAKLGSAMIWNDGHTYYFTTIKHSGVEGSPDGLEGVVRNHIYKVKITGVQGLGTPVYDKDEVYPPENPEYTTSSLYAEVSILSFRIVSNDVVLGQ